MSIARQIVARPALNRVRIVLSNGASITQWLPWQSEDPHELVWRFVDEDQFNDPAIVGKKSTRRIKGQLLQFQKRYGAQKDEKGS